MAASTCAAKPKQKRAVVSIEDQVAIIKQIESSSANVIAKRYGVGKNTVSDIKKNRNKILRFQQEMRDMGMSKKAKLMKVGDDEQHDKAVYLWFKQKRMEGVPISGPILCEKLSSCTRRCMVKSQISLEVQDGNGGSARGTEYATCPLKVRNYSLIQKQVQLSSHLSLNLLKSTSLLSIKFSIVMRLDLTFACCRTRH